VFKIYLKRERMFFDRWAVIQAMDEKQRRALAVAGAFIRKTAQRSMRWGVRRSKEDQAAHLDTLGTKAHQERARLIRATRRSPSPAGKPPKAWSGELRELLFFGWDAQSESMLVGPEGFRNSIAPSLHEFGGTLAVPVKYLGRGFPQGSRRDRNRKVKVKYPARPYMGPALNIALQKGKIPEPFKDSVVVRGAD
jgi:hypothetical protein